MASFNKVILMGNLTRDPQVRYTPGGTAVADVGLAVNRVWYDKQTQQKREETTFVDVTLWGRTAEVAGEYLSKGRPVLIEGRLQLDQWDDRETGKRRSKLKVVGETMQFIGGRSEGGSRGGGRSDFGNEYEEGPQDDSAGNEPNDSYDQSPSGEPPNDEVPF